MTEVTVKRASSGGIGCDPSEVTVSPEETVTWTTGDPNLKLTGVEFAGGSSTGFHVGEPTKGGASLAARATKRSGEYPYTIRYTDGSNAFEGAGKITVMAPGASSLARGSTGGGGGC